MSLQLPSTKYENHKRIVSGAVNVEDSDQVLYCDTSGAAVTVNLKQIPSNKWSTVYKLYVKDYTGNAGTNNITITAPLGFKINNVQSIVISVNDGCALIEISSNVDYTATLNFGIVGNNAIPVKNTAYVMKNGSDTTGLVERFDKPFLTISAAIAALNTAYPSRTSNSRLRVVVEDGTYTENIAIQSFIDLDLGNCVIDGSISDGGTDFGTIADGLWHVIIYGQAQLIRTTAGGSFGQAFILTKENNSVLLNCDLISCTINDAVAMLGGYAKIVCNNIQGRSTSASFHNAINMAVLSSSRCLLDVVGATIDTFLGGQSPAIDLTGTQGQTLTLINCQVRTKINNGTSSAAITAGRTSLSQNSILKLYNTTIYSQNGSSIEVLTTFGACNLTVYYIHSNVANSATAGAITTAMGTLTIDTALPY